MTPSPINIYNGATGVLLGIVDAAAGLREKSWLEEVPQWLQEAATPRGLGSANRGYGIEANFPTFLDGTRRAVNLIGNDTGIGVTAYSGTSVYKCIRNTQYLGTGDAAATTFGSTALTQPDLALANWANAGSNPANVPAPVGGQTPAWTMSDTGAGNYNLSATDGLITITVNGVAYVANPGTGTTTTIAQVRTAIALSGAPVGTALLNTNFILVYTLGLGSSQTLLISSTAGTAGAVVFATQGGTTYRGNGGPLNDQSAEGVNSSGVRPTHLLLPGSVSIACTMGAEVVTATDSTIATGTTGTATGQNAAGTATMTATLNYATGAVALTTAGDAPDNATEVTSTHKSLVELDLNEPARVPVGGMEIAVILK